jgi:uncharacterized protein (UPF0332 family)
MTSEEKQEYVDYRIKSAFQTFEAARVLADNGFWNSTVNRLYYSAFYAVNALLVLNDIQAKSHSSTKNQFAQHFIKTGIFDKKYGRLLSELFDWRQKGDYMNVFDYGQESVLPLFDQVKEMLELIQEEIDTQLG